MQTFDAARSHSRIAFDLAALLVDCVVNDSARFHLSILGRSVAMREATLDQILELVRNRAREILNQPISVLLEGFPTALPIKVMAMPDTAVPISPLVFGFHGAIDREKRSVPLFDCGFLESELSGRAFLISISDPLLSRHPKLRTTWYAGSEDLDVPAQIHSLVTALMDALRPSRTVFVAGSTGARTALLQSHKISDSYAVVSNPIIQISDYNSGHVSDYKTMCWPSIGDGDSWPGDASRSVAAIYSGTFPNRVVYLTNARDNHLWWQAIPFLNDIRRGAARSRLLLISECHRDRPGHFTPAEVICKWVSAVCDSPGPELTEIAETALRKTVQVSEARRLPVDSPRVEPAPFAEKSLAAHDLAIARKILESAQ